MSFSIIAAIGKNRELGKDGKLLWHLPEDLQFFKKTTMGHPILMGRKTFESLPGMLPGRKHYVVTRNQANHFSQLHQQDDNLVVIHNLPDFVEQPHDEEIFVIGGGVIYWEMLKYADALYLTEIDAEDEEADTFFPEFDKKAYDREVLGKGQDHGINYEFVKYTRK